MYNVSSQVPCCKTPHIGPQTQYHAAPHFAHRLLGPGTRQSIRRVLQDAPGGNHRNECSHEAHAVNSTRCHSTQGSPIPYLLAGLAAMLALVAFSLIVLACSYWKMVGCAEEENTETTNPGTSSAQAIDIPSCRMGQAGISDDCTKVVVIMAGEDKPTFLARPMAASESQATKLGCGVVST